MIKSIAYLYFQGKISLEDEKVLFDFINDNNENMKLFRQWESEWMTSGMDSAGIDDKWNSLQIKMAANKRVALQTRPMNRKFEWLPVAASIMLILSLSIYLYDRFVDNRSESYFISEVPKGQKSKVILPDGTLVWLNGGSCLRYPDNFTKDNRCVTLDGEGYFEVTSQNGKPFTIVTSDYDIVVKGTKFNVCAYDEDVISSTSLLEGKIEINYNDKICPVLPGEGVWINKNKRIIKRVKSNVSDSKAWIDGRIEFDRISFANLAIRLSRKYGVDITIENEDIKHKYFRVSLRNNETIKQVLDGLQFTLPFEYKIYDKNITIK